MTEATWLTSWTRTLNEGDALDLLAAAAPGTTVVAWESDAERELPQASRPRRREMIRIVREELLDHEDARITDSPFLRLFHGGSPHRRLDLLYGRLLARRPLVPVALDRLVHPALVAADAPLAPANSDQIRPETWDSFLRDVLRPGIPDEAFKKTRSTLQTALSRVGVLEITGNTTRTTRVRHGDPDPLAFAWTVSAEMARNGMTEAPETWARSSSFAARLFAPRPEVAEVCIDLGVREGLLVRGYLAGSARLHLPRPGGA